MLLTTQSRNPSVAASNTILLARLTMKAGIGPDGSTVISKRTRLLIDTLGLDDVLDMLTMLLECLFGIADHPVGAPVIFQDLLVDDPQNLDDGLYVMGPTVRVPVKDFDPFMHGRPGR